LFFPQTKTSEENKQKKDLEEKEKCAAGIVPLQGTSALEEPIVVPVLAPVLI
jgi:hypothetical protein